MTGKVLQMSDYKPEAKYSTFCRAQGLRAWRISTTLWLCIVLSEGKILRFLSGPNRPWKFVDANMARYLLSNL